MDASILPTIHLPKLPDISQPEMDFYESSFFRPATSTSPTPQLPPPALVREKTKTRAVRVVNFEHLNLVVKFGSPSRVKLEEAQAMWAIGQMFPAKDVPVPELYGWRVDKGENFIYMSLIKGPTLGEAWPLLTNEEKTSICGQLNQMVASLRRIQQPSPQPFIGSINYGQVQDIYFRGGEEAGPFHTVSAFNDWVQFTALSWLPMSERAVDPYRPLLPDTCKVYFTHADLHLYNIIISDTPSCRSIAGIVDWGQAGWYPEYWECCKLNVTGQYDHEWREVGWADSIMASYEKEWIALSEYWMWRIP